MKASIKRHRFARPGHDQRVIAWIRRDTDFVEHAGPQDLLALLIHRHEFEHGGTTALSGPRGGNGLLQSVGDIGCQRIVDTDDLCSIDRTALRYVQFLHQTLDLRHVAGRRIDDQ